MPVIVKVGVVAATVVVAAAIAIYESPQVRAFAVDCRRKIAVALHSLGDEINPNQSGESAQNRFNRPEDAEGFYQSGAGRECGVEADEESRRRQREELMYWNQLRLEKEAEKARNGRVGSATFDDFLHEDKSAEKGTYIYNSGADVHDDRGVVQRRARGVRELGAAGAYGAGSSAANPFADENHIEMDDAVQMKTDEDLMASSEMSDIYNVSEANRPQSRESTRTLQEVPALVDISEPFNPETPSARETAPESWNNMSSDMEAHPDAYEAIHAWANASQMSSEDRDQSFYSPLPTTPQQAMSETSDLEHLSRGDLTPTDSVSLAGSGEDIAADADEYDNMSESDNEGISTPGSWTEVGSVVSEEEHAQTS